METRFFSDPHFYHENMAIKRGFLNAEAMNEHIISCWNSVVKHKDITYLLGDITMEKSNYEILKRLNGVIHVVLGNHDQKQHVPELLKYVKSVSGIINYKSDYVLTHCPIHTSELKYRFKYNIHGHVHLKSILKDVLFSDYLGEKDSRYINVCAEVINYTPKTIKELLL